MRREEKIQIIENISADIKQYGNFYVTDIAGLNAEDTTKLRRECHKQGIKLVVVKNTLFNIALKGFEEEEIQSLSSVLVGNSAIMYCEAPNAPAKLIKKYNKDKKEKPALKGAYVQECAFIGAERLEELVSIKSKEELLGDIIGLLQSPAKNVISALNSAEGKLAGLVKTLSERE